MSNRFAIVVRVGHDDRDRLASALERQGLGPDRLALLRGPAATKTAVQHKLRQFRKRAEESDSVHIFWTGPVFHEAGQNYLAVADSQPDDLIGTSVPLGDLFALEAGTTFVFLDPVMTGARFEDVAPGMATEELDEFAATGRAGACFVAASGGETSSADVWMGLLTEALAGDAPEASGPTGAITVGSLAGFLDRALPRALRDALAEPPPQTPALFTALPDDAVVWEPVDPAGPARPPVDLERLRRAVLRAETSQKVKDLSGFQKSHRVPEMANAWAERFVGKVARADIKADIDEVFDALRQEMGFKRKELEAAADDDGTGFIRTPAFDYTVTVRVDPQSPDWVIWRREVGQIREPERVRGEPFRAVFGDTFDRLVFEFAEPLDVVAFVDHLEDHEPPGVRVRISSDGDHCEVSLDGFKGSVRIDANTLQIDGSSASEAGGLVGQFFEFVSRFDRSSGGLALPLESPREADE